jgi:hypothetical protein
MGLTLPICFGLLGIAYSGRAPAGSNSSIILIELIVFSFAITLSIYFSELYEQTKDYLIGLEAGKVTPFYSAVVIRRRGLGARFRRLDGINKSLLLAGLFLHLVFFLREVLPALVAGG